MQASKQKHKFNHILANINPFIKHVSLNHWFRHLWRQCLSSCKIPIDKLAGASMTASCDKSILTLSSRSFLKHGSWMQFIRVSELKFQFDDQFSILIWLFDMYILKKASDIHVRATIVFKSLDWLFFVFKVPFLFWIRQWWAAHTLAPVQSYHVVRIWTFANNDSNQVWSSWYEIWTPATVYRCCYILFVQ